MVDSRKTWNGYHVFAVDGSKLQLPDSKDIRSVFGSRFNTSDPSQVYSLALCSTLYDVLEDIIVDAAIYPDLSSERYAVYEHLNDTLDLDIFHNSILIFDRGYYSAQIYCDFYNRGLLCLMRVKKSLKITRSDSDNSIQFIKDPVSGLDVPARVIRVVLDSGTVEYLVTNVFDSSITPEMFKQLYFFRWKILYEPCSYTNYSGRNALNISIPASESSYKTLSPGQGFWTVPLHHPAIVAPLPE